MKNNQGKLTETEQENTGVVHGRWGEDVAAAQMVVEGFTILERNVHPCRRDKRLEIDIIAYDRKHDLVVFVEVKQHKGYSVRQKRLRSITMRKRRNLLRACRTWLLRKKWSGSYRFDVIEVYGDPESNLPPEVDHIQHVRLFTTKERFVNWEV